MLADVNLAMADYLISRGRLALHHKALRGCNHTCNTLVVLCPFKVGCRTTDLGLAFVRVLTALPQDGVRWPMDLLAFVRVLSVLPQHAGPCHKCL